jgi:hypothetical protein
MGMTSSASSGNGSERVLGRRNVVAQEHANMEAGRCPVNHRITVYASANQGGEPGEHLPDHN